MPCMGCERPEECTRNTCCGCCPDKENCPHRKPCTTCVPKEATDDEEK